MTLRQIMTDLAQTDWAKAKAFRIGVYTSTALAPVLV